MKTRFILFIILHFVFNATFAQDFVNPERLQRIDNVKQKLQIEENDTSQVKLLNALANIYKFNKPDSAIHYAIKAIELAKQSNFLMGEIRALQYLLSSFRTLGNESKAMEIALRVLKMSEKYKIIDSQALALLQIGNINYHSKNYLEALKFYRESYTIFDSIQDYNFATLILTDISAVFNEMNQMDSAWYYIDLAYNNVERLEISDWAETYLLIDIGSLYTKDKNYVLALENFRKPMSNPLSAGNFYRCYIGIAKVFREMGKTDSCIYYAGKSLEIAEQSGIIRDIVDANILLAEIYRENDYRKAYEYSNSAIFWKDSLSNLVNSTAIESFLDFDEQQRNSELQQARTEFNYRLQMNAFLGSSFTFIVVVILLFILYRRKQKAKQKIELAYDQLKSTQTLLIQSEKMASLGELTAGIAHEIQNPLNFVNNFSEVNSELIDELNDELANGEIGEAKAIAGDIKQNLQKILHHGKRADAIVKGMLQHSRASSGQKELTDINALCDEYLRLSYHGLRAKDKSFNADFKLEADESLPKIDVVPQDIGRVLLNLINNAFYACAERSRTAVNEKVIQNMNEYQPIVVVSTKLLGNKVEIRVQDNGNGIPDSIKGKIFQPFFTTKPTGQGTGLGLSLSYDIVKAHGGELKVETKEGEGTDFIIQIPVH